MGNNIYKKIEILSIEIEKEVIKWRHHIHKNPELSNREYKTAEYVSKHLIGLGLEVKKNIAHTGVVAVLHGNKSGKTVALRADMDALPVVERVNIPFASKVKTIYKDIEVGVMHACGHDTHVAILMGVASVLSELKNEIKGTVKFIFQPAEENEAGGRVMCEDGLFELFPVEAVSGMHNQPGLPLGQFGVRVGGQYVNNKRIAISLKHIQRIDAH